MGASGPQGPLEERNQQNRGEDVTEQASEEPPDARRGQGQRERQGGNILQLRIIAARRAVDHQTLARALD